MITTVTVKDIINYDKNEDCFKFLLLTKEGTELIYYNKNSYKIGDQFDISIHGHDGTYVFYKI